MMSFSPSNKYVRFASVGRLMIAFGRLVVVLVVRTGIGKQPRGSAISIPGPQVFPGKARLPVVPGRQVGAAPRDRFVVIARAEIDPEMVVPAPVGIDEAMVFNPHRRASGSRTCACPHRSAQRFRTRVVAQRGS